MVKLRNRLIQQFEFPKKTILNRHVPKTSFFQNADLTKSEQELFTSQIDGIYLLSIMNQDSMNIPEYRTDDKRYEVINWMYVKLRSSQHINRVINAIHKAIPNPLVLIIGLENNHVLLSSANKRLNKVDERKTVIEEPIYTNWFALEDLEEEYRYLLGELIPTKLSTENLFEFYQDIHDWLQCEKTIEIAQTFPKGKQKRNELIAHIDQIEIYKTRSAQLLKAEKDNLNFGDKMKLHIQQKKIEEQIVHQIEKIKELC